MEHQGKKATRKVAGPFESLQTGPPAHVPLDVRATPPPGPYAGRSTAASIRSSDPVKGNQYAPPGPLTESPGDQLAAFGIELTAIRATTTDPASTERQRKFACAELGRLRAGKRTKTRMTDSQLRDFCTP